MKIDLIEYTNKKNLNIRSSRHQYNHNDSIDHFIVDNIDKVYNKPKLEFALEPTAKKKI